MSQISACEKSGEWQLALGLLSEMAESTVQQDAVSCNAALSVSKKGSFGSWHWACWPRWLGTQCIQSVAVCDRRL